MVTSLIKILFIHLVEVGEAKAADPQEPVTRKGYLISLKTGERTEIRERDVVSLYFMTFMTILYK